MNTISSAPPDRTRQRGWRGEALRQAFAAAGQSRPWTRGYRSLDSDRVEAEAQISGQLPSELRGTLYRNGPARHERGGQRYGHRWDGDGMIQRFSLSDGKVCHVGQYVHTRKYQAESASDRFLVSGFGTHIPGSDPVPADIPASAGALVDRAGLKGTTIGGATISPTHANFIVNDGTARAADIRALIEMARTAVRIRFGVELRDEVVFLGTF